MQGKQLFEKVISSPHPFLFLIAKDRNQVKDEILSLYKEGHEDAEVSLFDTKQVTVPLVKEILALALTQAIKKRVFIISFYTFLDDAQNKMLKTLEESHSMIRFIFVTESKQSILPTILSRAEVVDLASQGGDKEKNFDTKLFLSTAKTLRLEIPFVKMILAKKDEEDRKDKELLTQFLFELMEALPRRKEGMKGRRDILEFLKYTKDASASGKMILGHLALSLPVVLE